MASNRSLPPAVVEAGLPEDDLAVLRRIAEGEWDLNTRLEAEGDEAETLNLILENLAKTLTEALRCGVRLYGNVPPLFDFSAKLEGAARTQEDHAAQIAASARQMEAQLHAISDRLQEALQFTADVAGIVADLDTRSRQIEKVVDRVQRVAGQTKLLSLNASVEAARAGAAGRAFAVVAEEVQKLAADAAKATTEIHDVLHDLEERIGVAVRAVGRRTEEGAPPPAAGDAAATTLTRLMEGLVEQVREQNAEVGQVVGDIGRIAGEARLQTEGAAKLKEMANRAREGSDALIVSLGGFRLPVHIRPRDLVARLADDPAIRSMDRFRQEEVMAAAAERHRFIELLYITDPTGRQVTENIARKGVAVSRGHGADWSKRPWFQNPVQSGELCLSDIYRSSASDRFCFTVSTPIRGEHDTLAGILAVDIDLTQLI